MLSPVPAVTAFVTTSGVPPQPSSCSVERQTHVFDGVDRRQREFDAFGLPMADTGTSQAATTVFSGARFARGLVTADQ